MTDNLKFNSMSGISRIYSLYFSFWTGRSSKILSYSTPLHHTKHLRILYCIIIGAALISGTIASNGIYLLLENLMLILPAAGDWGCTGNTQDTVKNVQKQNPYLLLALGDYRT